MPSISSRHLFRALRICNFGDTLVPYAHALELQQRLAEACRMGAQPDTLLQLQHPPVYTLGKRGRPDDFRTSQEELRRQGADIASVGRGGETTFHGPGQIVLYPIADLRRLGRGARAYVEGLEDTIIAALGGFGISAQGRQPPGRTGVWVQDRKIAAIGVQISRGIASHGCALNVATDLSYYRHIVPCGIPDKEVTSVEAEIGTSDGLLHRVAAALQSAFIAEFAYGTVTRVMPDDLWHTRHFGHA